MVQRESEGRRTTALVMAVRSAQMPAPKAVIGNGSSQ